MNNLRLINDTTITSGSSTVSITDVFSEDFEVYKIIISDMTTVGTTQTSPDFRFINSSCNVINTLYDYGHQIMRADSGFTEQYATSQAQFYRFQAESVDQAPESQGVETYIFNPFETNLHSYVMYQSMTSAAGLHLSMKGIGVQRTAGSMTGFQVIDSNATRPFASGNVKTYGLRVD